MDLVVLKTISGLSFIGPLNEKIIVNTIQNSFNLMKSFISNHHEQINEVLLENDLYSKLEIIQALMIDIEGDQDSLQKQSIQKSLLNLHMIVEDILKLLEIIDQKIKYHNTKYFSKWRSINYEKQIVQLKKSIQILDRRYQMFLEVLKVR